jgi:hypothetical protein
MPVTFVPKAALSAFVASVTAPQPLTLSTKPVDLSGVARLRVRDVVKLLNVSRATFYEGVRSGRYPKADGYDEKRPFWRAGTLQDFLQ